MKLIDTLNGTSGRFTSLVVGNKRENNTYCANSIAATSEYVSFIDVNTGLKRRVATAKVLAVRSGKMSYARA